MGDWAYDRDGSVSFPNIITTERLSGIPMSVTSTTGGGHANGSWHYTGNAVDFSDGTDTANEAKLAQWIMDNYGGVTGELIHSGGKGYYINNGKVVPASFYASELARHHNHVHWAITNKGIKDKVGPNTSPGIDLPDPTGLLGPVKGLLDFAKQLVKLFTFFTDPHNWWRIAEFILGCGLLYLGVRGLNLAAVNAVTKPADQVFKSAKRNVKKAQGAVKSNATVESAPKPKPVSDATRRSSKINAVKRGLDTEPLTSNAAALAIKDTVG